VAAVAAPTLEHTGVIVVSVRPLLAPIAVVLLGAAACATAPPSAPPHMSVGPSTRSTPPVAEFCEVPLPDSWQAALDAGMLPREEDEQALVKLIATDGSLLIESKVAGRRNELRWHPGGGSDFKVVHDFGPANPQWQALGSSFDGRYLAYSVAHSFSTVTGEALYVWDSQASAEPQLVARNESGADGPGAVGDPVAYDGFVAWFQVAADDPDQTSLHRYRIDDGSRDVVSTGDGSAAVRMGPWLLWSEGDRAERTLRAVSFRSGEPGDLPAPLAAIAGLAFTDADADADTVAWTDADMHELLVWRTDWAEPIVAVRSEDSLQWVHVAGDLVSWGSTAAQFALDLRSGSYTQITPEFGSQLTGGPYLGVGFAPGRRPGVPFSDQTVMDTRDLPPLPGCD
jgi:hypothetical protein